MAEGDIVELEDGRARLIYLQEQRSSDQRWLVQYEGDVRQYSRLIRMRQTCGHCRLPLPYDCICETG